MSAGNSQHILLIASEFPPDVGGIGNHAYNLAKALSIKGFTVTVLADVLKKQSFIESYFFKFYPVFRSRITPVTYFERVVKAIRLSGKADVIICSGKFSLWLIKPLKFFYKKKKYIAVLHGTELLIENKNVRTFTLSAVAQFDALIAVSNFTKALLPQQMLAQKKITVINNGIDHAEFAAMQSDLVHTPSTSGVSLITIGSVTERKGQENVIRALPLIRENFASVKYHVVGKPVMQVQLMCLIRDLKLEDVVVFHGAVERKVLINLLEKADIKMMLSNAAASGDVEGFGIAVLEANACGKPAVGSLQTGVEDAIEDDVTGRLVHAKDVEEIKNAVMEIVANYKSYSLHAKQWAEAHDWLIVVDKYIDVISR